MNRRFAWLGGAVGAFAVWKWFRRRPAAAEPAAPDPAEELRAKLAESRAVVEEQRAEAAEPETPVNEAADPEARRRSVHDDARARIERLREE